MIGGNITAILQVNAGITTNSIGERIPTWIDAVELTGFLDYQSGDAVRTTYNAKLQETTHVFVCNYKPIPATLEVNGEIVQVNTENARMVANSKRYDVLMIDDPMELHDHLEIFLKFTGGQ